MTKRKLSIHRRNSPVPFKPPKPQARYQNSQKVGPTKTVAHCESIREQTRGTSRRCPREKLIAPQSWRCNSLPTSNLISPPPVARLAVRRLRHDEVVERVRRAPERSQICGFIAGSIDRTRNQRQDPAKLPQREHEKKRDRSPNSELPPQHLKLNVHILHRTLPCRAGSCPLLAGPRNGRT